MEPIGTITNYFPFLDEESIDIVDRLMREAPNYISFVNDLVDIICREDLSLELRYVGLFHAADTSNQLRWEVQTKPENLVKLQETFEDDIVVRALTFWSTRSNPTDEAIQNLFDIVDNALKTTPNQWVTLILLLWAGGLAVVDPKANIYLDKAIVMFSNNEKLEFLRGYLHQIQGNVLRQEGNNDDAEKEFERGIAISKKCDHLYLLIHLHDGLGNIRKNTDAHAALVELDTAYRLSKELSDKELERSLLFSMGLIYTILGEYDLALHAHFESIEGIKSNPRLIPSLTIARLFCDLGMGAEALEWIQWGESDTGESFHVTMWQLAKALSLIQIGRVEEAARIIDMSREKALKSGQDWTMQDYHYVEGNYYLATNDIHSALDQLERALKLSEQMNIQIFINRCLIALTKAETALVIKEKDRVNPESSGLWMSKLKTHSEEKNYLGIRMQHAILKADYQSMMNDFDSARETLVEALKISDSPSVNYHIRAIEKRIANLDKLLVGC